MSVVLTLCWEKTKQNLLICRSPVLIIDKFSSFHQKIVFERFSKGSSHFRFSQTRSFFNLLSGHFFANTIYLNFVFEKLSFTANTPCNNCLKTKEKVICFEFFQVMRVSRYAWFVIHARVSFFHFENKLFFVCIVLPFCYEQQGVPIKSFPISFRFSFLQTYYICWFIVDSNSRLWCIFTLF